MTPALPGFLDRAMRTPFAWGTFDCVLWLADWSVTRLGTDPAAAYRGRYSTALGAGRIVAEAGGLAQLIGREFRPRGWLDSEDLGPGDIGVIEVVTREGLRPTGALFTGRHWVTLAEGGLNALVTPALASWRPLCPRP